MAIKIVETFSVSPSDSAATEKTLPLVYFDMQWLHFPPTETLHFYTFKSSESYFLDTTLAQLKHSLSITLRHFLPLAGKIVFPLTSANMPFFRYAAGDSVSFTIAVSDADFADMTGNHFRTADEFHHLVPQMPPAVYSDNDLRFSSLAVQATLFPNQGICIGISHNHAVCDGRSLIGFVGAWASVNKLKSDGHLVGNALPFYDRSRVQESTQLDRICWEKAKMSRPTVSSNNRFIFRKIRATFILSDSQIGRLKEFATMKKPAIGRVSSFVVVSAHLWSCIVKSGAQATDDEPEYLSFPVDCRQRLEPPLPENFFGNCLLFKEASTTHGKLRGDEGFVEGVESIAAAIDKTVKHGRGISEYFENRGERFSELIGKRVVWLAGSSRIDHYGVDYGWGRAIKYECIHTDSDGAVCLCKGRDGGVEIQLSMTKANMDAFAAAFNKELSTLL